MRLAIKIVLVLAVSAFVARTAVRLATGRPARPLELVAGTLAVASAIVIADAAFGF